MKRSARQQNKSLNLDGEEPILSVTPSVVEIIRAYNWYSANCDETDAVEYITDYMRAKKVPKEQIRLVSKINPFSLRNIGWNCRILTNGGDLPGDIKDAAFAKLSDLIERASTVADDSVDVAATPVVSIQDRIRDRTVELIGTLEVEIDNFCINEKSDFDVADWFRKNAIKPMIAKKIAEYYQPVYSEVFDALKGKDEDLKYAYRHWKKPVLKKYLEFIKSIITTAETNAVVVRTARNPRKKKVKPASVIVAKLKYCEKDETLNLVSVNPATLVGCDQLWCYNIRNRTLSVYNALGPVGLSVKGQTLTGFDEKTSITKKLRKPKETLERVLSGGKIVLRKLMDEIKTATKEANGRINNETILLRAIKP